MGIDISKGRVLALFIFLIILSHSANSQSLSGIYTVGGLSSDFSSITDAVNNAELYGISGPVTFNLSPGTYQETNTLTNIAGDTSYSITFQSSTSDSSDVIIQNIITNSNDALIKINNNAITYERSFIFLNLTLKTLTAHFPLCLYATYCSVSMKHCLIQGSYSSSSVLDYNRLIDAQKIKSFSVDSCTFDGTYYGFIFNGGNFDIRHSRFLNNRFASIYALYNTNPIGHFNLESCTLEALYDQNIGGSYFYNCDSLTWKNNNFFQAIDVSYLCNTILISKNFFRRNLSINSFNYCLLDSNEIDSSIAVSSPAALIQYNSFDTLATDENSLKTSNAIIQFNHGDHLDITYCNNVKVLHCNFKKFYFYPVDAILLQSDTLSAAYDAFNMVGCNNITVDSCHIGGTSEIDFGGSITIQDNTFSDNLNIFHATDVSLEKNAFKDVELGFCEASSFQLNRARHLSINYCTSTSKIFNNYLNGGIELGYDNDSVLVYFNNIFTKPFIPEFPFNNEAYYSGLVFLRNNNLNKDIIIPAGAFALLNLDYNNYYPLGGDTQSHSIFVDPQYTDTIDLTAHNPILAGKALDLTNTIEQDIDGNERFHPPTIGANEICLANSITQVIQVNCGDELTLNVCNYDSTFTYSWWPINGLSNPTIPNPLLTVDSSQLFICTITHDSSLIEIDSVIIEMTPFQVRAKDTMIQYCGYGLYLNSTWNSSATYHWTPSTGLSDTNIRDPFANPQETTAYIVEATIPGCGSSFDTIKVTVDSLPIAYAYILSQNHNVISYLNASTCANSYLWLFGDNTSDTTLNPTHTYYSTGLLLLTLIAYNSFGSDTFSGYVYIDSLITSSPTSIASNSNLKIFPNPTSSTLNINLENFAPGDVMIQVMNQWGKVELEKTIEITSQDYKGELNVAELPSGIYLIKISLQNKILSTKFIKL